jgi:hypothetical protein
MLSKFEYQIGILRSKIKTHRVVAGDISEATVDTVDTDDHVIVES